jgi:hypothetical protein
MSLNAVATNQCFRGLLCAYTGEPITVRVIAHGGAMPRYFSPDAFDPSVPDPDMASLLRKTGTRNGVIGAMPEGAERVCPYTGAPMALRNSELGFSLSGGFRPSNPVTDPYLLARSLLMRGGVLPAGAEALIGIGRVTVSAREPVETRAAEPTSPSDDAMAAVESLAVSAASRPLQVSVPASVPGGVPTRRANRTPVKV